MPDATPAIDMDAINKSIAKTVATAIEASNKALIEQIGKLVPPAPAAPATPANPATPATPAPALTANDVAKIVGEQLKGFTSQQQQTAARDAYLAQKLADLPAAYKAQLGSDPSKWAAEEQAIRDSFKDDLGKLGLKVPDVTGSPTAAPGAQAPSARVAAPEDKRSPIAKITAGLAEDRNFVGPTGQTSRGTTVDSAATAAAK